MSSALEAWSRGLLLVLDLLLVLAVLGLAGGVVVAIGASGTLIAPFGMLAATFSVIVMALAAGLRREVTDGRDSADPAKLTKAGLVSVTTALLLLIGALVVTHGEDVDLRLVWAVSLVLGIPAAGTAVAAVASPRGPSHES